MPSRGAGDNSSPAPGCDRYPLVTVAQHCRRQAIVEVPEDRERHPREGRLAAGVTTSGTFSFSNGGLTAWGHASFVAPRRRTMTSLSQWFDICLFPGGRQ